MSELEKYFVLRPKGTDLVAKASRAALRQYAKLIREENSQLADDLEAWALKEGGPGDMKPEYDFSEEERGRFARLTRLMRNE